MTPAKPTTGRQPCANALSLEQVSDGYRLLFEQARDVFLFVRCRDGAILEANAAAEASASRGPSGRDAMPATAEGEAADRDSRSAPQGCPSHDV